ncbi:ervatamin-B-like isoform X3 [Daphnia pulicaria]|uniref:ervatamin-B-like isoform X3 n=1 Tax=Daphnia pulicaria TaxID=35523 RepID=UPI001EEA5646|nr:ervatamin-B-like isoform X3 [Daphnia pulicaria]
MAIHYFKLKHGKDYTTFCGGGWRDKMRKDIFIAERQLVNQYNSNESRSYSQELNRFSDMWPSEKSKYLGLKSSRAPSIQFMKSIQRYYPLLNNRQSLPAELDYRSDDCMAAIKDQGPCGSCWAFAAVTPLEFNSCKKHRQTPVALSEQQLVDCDIFNNGCNGGWYTQAWQHIKLAGGLARESLYPYTATRNFCPFWFLWFMTGARVFRYDYAPANDAVAMQSALQQYGPLTVAIAIANSFFSYKDGVYDATDCDNVDVNHAVVVVGWGNKDGVDYWIIRNSWGTGWGLSGYGLIHRGVNKCKMESYPAYVRPL